MSGYQRIIATVISVGMVFGYFFVNAQASMDTASWEDSTTYTLLEEGEKSNSAYECIFVKVKYDFSAHRIHLFFMTCLTSFTDVNLAGVQMSFNNFGSIKMMVNGKNEYNESVYYSDMDYKYDALTKTLYFEVTVGIKQGIPENVYMNVNFIDTEGIPSNTFSVDITPIDNDETTVTDAKTSKQTNIKTTKTKTSTTKKTTTKKTKTVKAEKNETEEDETDDSEIIGSNDPGTYDVGVSNEKSKIIWIAGASAAVFGIGAGCAVGIRKKHKEK